MRARSLGASVLLSGVPLLLAGRAALAQAPPQLPPPPPPPVSTTPPPPRGETREPRETPPPRREPSGSGSTQSPATSGASRPVRAAPPQYAYAERDRDDAAPPPRLGFQGALRTGYSLPMSSIANGTKMSDAFAGQVPLFAEAGAKITQNLFIGGYMQVGFGGSSGAMKSACAATNSSCVAASFRLGVEVQYHFQPGEKLNPWIGYGLGYESNGVGRTVNGRDTSVSYSGFELARLSAGLDFRISRAVAVGPFLDLALGQYTREHDVVGGASSDHDIGSTAMHQWLTLGARVTFLP